MHSLAKFQLHIPKFVQLQPTKTERINFTVGIYSKLQAQTNSVVTNEFSAV